MAPAPTTHEPVPVDDALDLETIEVVLARLSPLDPAAMSVAELDRWSADWARVEGWGATMRPRVAHERAVRAFTDQLAAQPDTSAAGADPDRAGSSSNGDAAPQHAPGPVDDAAAQAPQPEPARPAPGPRPSQTSRRQAARDAKVARLIAMFPTFGAKLERGELTVEHVLALDGIRNRATARQHHAALLNAALAHTAEDFAGWLRMWDAEVDLGLGLDNTVRQRRKRSLRFFDTGADLGEFRAALPPAEYDALKRTLMNIDSELRRRPDCDPTATWEQRMADALVEMMHRANATGTSASGAGGSLRTAVIVLIDLKDLLEGTGHGTTADGMPVDVGEVRRMAAREHLIPVVLGTDSVPLDIGRAARYAHDTQWLGSLIRDGGCVLCNSPLGVLDAHHSIEWELGGCTDLCHLVLLCRHCHRKVHAEHITIDITNGKVTATRPDGTPLPTYNRHNRRPPPHTPPPP